LRYKTLPVFLRGDHAPDRLSKRPERSNQQEPRSWADWPATLILILAVPALILPLIVVLAGTPSLSATPGADAPGSQIRLAGTNFPAHIWGQLTFDGSAAGLPRFRTDAKGSFSAAWTIPSTTTLGTHTLAALGPAGKKGSQAPAATANSAGKSAGKNGPAGTSAGGKSPSAAGNTAPTVIASTTLNVVTAQTPAPTPTLAPTPRVTPVPTPTPSTTPPAGWVNLVNDQFDSGGVPAHWGLYDGPYGSNTHNCAVPSHVTVSGGYLHLLMGYEASGKCGAGWYTAGMRLNGFSAIDQRVTLRFRIVDSGASAHYVIPMRWPDLDSSWPAGGEEDYCESDATTGCSTYLHYSSSNAQVNHAYAVDTSQWHTMQFTRLNHVVTTIIDGALAWSYTGSSATLPDTLKHVVLQQECRSTGCPAGTSGSSEILVDWLTVDGPSASAPPPTGSATPTPTPTPSSTPSATPSATPVPPGGAIQHVFLVVMENQSYSNVIGQPYTANLASTWAHATNYHAITHPSLPNYLDLYAGSNHGITTDCDPSPTCHISGISLGDELSARGLTWKGYFEGMAAPCTLTNPGTYRAHHDPFIYFDDMWQNPSPGGLCYSHVVPMFPNLTTDLASARTTPNFAFVKPDNCHDTHDCSLAVGDTWLSQNVPLLLNSPACTVDKCLVILTWDEDDGSEGNRVLTVFAGSGAKTGYTDGTSYNHYGLLRTIEDLMGVAYQANDATATSMAGMLR
jgi:phosphatidylinositol-3-phosphatase